MVISPIFSVFKARCNAVVPFETGKQLFIFVNLENFFSNKFTYLPIDEIQPVLIQSVKYLSSFPLRFGLANDI